MSRPIPVLIVAGFLGAGKTTLLNHLLRNTAGARVGVVVNDFGAINIDSMLVAGQVDSMVSVGNGCVCCAVDVGELDVMFGRLANPRSDIDVIVVEASGLAEPKNLVRLVVGSENPLITYGGLIELVDAAEFDATLVRHPELSGHLRLADLVVLNKSDRVGADELSRLTERIRVLVGAVPIVATTGGRVDPTLLFDLPERAPAAQLSLDQLLLDEHHDDHRHLHDDYVSASFTSREPLHPRALLAIFEDPPIGLYRAKGIVRFATAGRARTFEIHVVGQHIRITPRKASGDSSLVVIGAGLDVDDVTRRLQATVHTGDPLDADALLPVWRYVQPTF